MKEIANINEQINALRKLENGWLNVGIMATNATNNIALSLNNLIYGTGVSIQQIGILQEEFDSLSNKYEIVIDTTGIAIATNKVRILAAELKNLKAPNIKIQSGTKRTFTESNAAEQKSTISNEQKQTNSVDTTNSSQLAIAAANNTSAIQGLVDITNTYSTTVSNAVESSVSHAVALQNTKMQSEEVQHTFSITAGAVNDLTTANDNATIKGLDFVDKFLQPGVEKLQSFIGFAQQMGFDMSALTGVVDTLNIGLGIYNGVMDFAKIKVGELTIAEWLLNESFLANPIVAIIAAVVALVGMIVYAYNHFGKFRAILDGVWASMKEFANLIKDLVISRIKSLLSGIMGVGKSLAALFSGDFSGAYDAIVEAGKDLLGINEVKMVVERSGKIVDAGKTAYDNSLKKSAEEEKAKTQKNTPLQNSPVVPVVDFPKDLLTQQRQMQPVAPAMPSIAPGNGNARQANTQNNTSSTQANNITNGGTKKIDIHINKFFDNINISAQKIDQGYDQMEQKIVEVMLRVLGSANAIQD